MSSSGRASLCMAAPPEDAHLVAPVPPSPGESAVSRCVRLETNGIIRPSLGRRGAQEVCQWEVCQWEVCQWEVCQWEVCQWEVLRTVSQREDQARWEPGLRLGGEEEM